MCSPKYRILKLLKNNLIVSKSDLYSRIKSAKTSTIINWLINNNYVIEDQINPDKIILTDRGVDYQRETTKQLIRMIAIIVSIPAALAAIYHLSPERKMAPDEPTSYIQVSTDSTFYINNYQKFGDLVSKIELKSSYTFDLSSKNTFEITFSGDIVELRMNYYFYPGGCLVIKYDGEVIRKFDFLRIDNTSRDGSLNHVLSDELDRRIGKILSHNKEMISNEIISILTDQ